MNLQFRDSNQIMDYKTISAPLFFSLAAKAGYLKEDIVTWKDRHCIEQKRDYIILVRRQGDNSQTLKIGISSKLNNRKGLKPKDLAIYYGLHPAGHIWMTLSLALTTQQGELTDEDITNLFKA